MSVQVRVLTTLLLGLGLPACTVSDADPTGAPEADRGPIGKADAEGTCRDADGANFCGGPSAGACWCDDLCVDFGDCCSDVVAVCEGLDLAVDAIDSAATFDAMAFSGSGGVVIGKSVKFVIDARDPSALQLQYLNANFDGAVSDERAKELHFFFAQEVFGVTEGTGEFNSVTYFTNDKRYYAGTLQQYEFGDAGVTYGIQFYPQDQIAEQSVLTAVSLVQESFSIPDARLAFVATGPQQTTTTVTAAIEDLGVGDLTLDQVLGSLDYLPMQLGEAWGFLRIFPENQDLLSAIDIPVFDELPLDLTVVAGTITRAFQDASSHVNLKSKERGTPNMVLRSASPEHPRLAEFDGLPVHIVVDADDFTIELSTEEEVREKLAEKLDKPWQPLEIDETAEIASYDAMCPTDEADCLGLAPAYGGKAGNLGFLRHRDVLGAATAPGSVSAQLGYDAAPAGIGVPVQRYVELVEHNPELKEEVDTFVAAEKEGVLSVVERVAALDSIREGFLAAEMPPGLEDDIRAAVADVLPAETESIKVRSSANAEDIPGFDGAGLYESHRGNLDKVSVKPCRFEIDEDDGSLEVKPKTVECAVKGVYASLWNKRAVEERSFARIDHETAAMGLAIVRRYKERAPIGANSVVVTRVLNSSGVFGYTFSNQVGNNVVTNPAPGTQSETIIAAFLPGVDPSFTVTRFAKPDPAVEARTETVMTNDRMLELLEISQAVEVAYCRAKPEFYEGPCSNVTFDIDKPTALDMEYKLYENGEFLCKQVREFAGQ